METFWMYFQNQDRNFGKGYSACRFCYKESKNHKSCHHESISIAWVPVLTFSGNIGNASKLGLFLADKTGGKNQLTSADVLHLCEIRASPTSCWMARTPSAIVVPADCYTPPATKGLYTPLCLEASLPTVILCFWPNTIPVTLQTSVQEPSAENCVVSGCYNGLRCVCVAYSVSSATDGDYRDPCAHVEGPGDQERPRVPCIIIGDYASSALRASSQTSIRTSCIQLMDSIPMSIHDNGLRKNMCLLISEDNFKSQTSPLFHVWLSRP